MQQKNDNNNLYIDLFSGCGGLSLGLGNAGWTGVLAVEKDPMAFATFKHNLIDGKHAHFNWPEWLPKKELTIQEIIEKYYKELKELKGKISLIAGGPPCQGFSLAGLRNENDPRNKLSNEYIKMVEIVSPKFILLENVRGFNSAFKVNSKTKDKKPYSIYVREKLENLGYDVFSDYICSADFGVPQKRTRFIMIGIKRDLIKSLGINPFNLLNANREKFLESKSLPTRHITVSEAISDLEIRNKDLIYHSGNLETGFKQLKYINPKIQSDYLKFIRNGMGSQAPNSMRLANHRPDTIKKFKTIQDICKPGVSLSDQMREIIGTRKQAITVLNKNEPSKTLTTLPDDLLHYSEARILTVRENARIQSFPDSFDILGKYTTGGERRTKECPRYTQVGNAVPPLLAEALGITLQEILRQGIYCEIQNKL